MVLMSHEYITLIPGRMRSWSVASTQRKRFKLRNLIRGHGHCMAQLNHQPTPPL
uniref:Uncharacterized protein n=1 Tax=Arundo donax TaxID=35708 RepID=A0A0A9HBC4_ARUDO